jgi:hypothetical protein
MDEYINSSGFLRRIETPVSAGPFHPSLRLYSALLVLAAVLICISFRIGGEHEAPALFLHLGCEIVGAVFVMLVIERRIRHSEAARFRHLTRWGFLLLVSPRARMLAHYAQVLCNELDNAKATDQRLEVHISDLSAPGKGPCLLLDGSSAESSIVLRRVAIRLAYDLAEKPREAPIPVVVPMRNHIGASLEFNTWFEGMLPFVSLSHGAFTGLLETGRVVLLLEGIDESPKRAGVLGEATAMIKRFPKTRLVVTSRSLTGPNEAEQIECIHLAAPEVVAKS